MKKIIYLFLSILFFTSCSEDDHNHLNPNASQEVTFGITQKNQSNNVNGEILTPTKVVVTLKNITTDTLVYNKKVLDLFNFNGQYLTQNVTLTVGEYAVEDYFVTDANNKVVYASPKEGSELAQYVNDPLPLNFSVTLDEVTQVLPEVLVVDEDYTPEQFGYASFGFTIVTPESLTFDIVSFDNDNQITNFNLTIKSDDQELFNQDLEAQTNSIHFNTNHDAFQLIISKEGYETQTFNYTKEELEAFISQNNMKIYLKAVEKIFEGDVWLTTIEEYDAFTAEEYTAIIGSLYLENLSGLTNIDKLSTLTKITEKLSISTLENITNLDGFNSLEEVKTIYFEGGVSNISSNLKNISGFNNVTTIDSIIIESDFFNEINGFNKITQANIIQLGNINAYSNIKGFENLKTVNDLRIIATQIDSFKELERIENNLFLMGVTNSNLTFFESLNYIGNDITILLTNHLINLEGLEFLTTIGNLYITIGVNHHAFEGYKGLENLKTIKGNFTINRSDLNKDLSLETIENNLILSEEHNFLMTYCFAKDLLENNILLGDVYDEQGVTTPQIVPKDTILNADYCN